MSIKLVRVFWQSHPYGWSLRQFVQQGEYHGELISSAPPHRDLCSGWLNSADAATAWRLVVATLTSAATEAFVAPPDPYIGFVVPIGTDDEQYAPYYYYPQDDKRDSTRSFVKLVLILDTYLRAHYVT